MPVIKRYSNRKLYDSESKRYVTLGDLAEFVRQGEEVRVIDHATGVDLTSPTLLQVVFEEQKKIGGMLPQIFLTRLIRAGGEKVSSLRGRLASLDPFQVVDEEIRRRLALLVEEGRVSAEEGARILDLLLRRPPQADVIHIPVKFEEEPEQRSPAESSPAPDEINALARQVDALEQELARLKATSAS